MVPTRNDAERLLEQYIDNPALRNHCRAVAATMGYVARQRGAEPEPWQVIGLVHDLDWEKFPEQHCRKTEQILRAADWPDEYVRAVVSHGWQICTDVEPLSDLEKTLYAIDELTGFVTACALVRPSRSVRDLEVKSVRKKWKSANFAAGVDREVIERGAGMLDAELNDLIRSNPSSWRSWRCAKWPTRSVCSISIVCREEDTGEQARPGRTAGAQERRRVAP